MRDLTELNKYRVVENPMARKKCLPEDYPYGTGTGGGQA